MTALAELSVLLGVTVTDVRRERIDDGERQPDDSAWRLELPGTRFGVEDPTWLGDSRPWSRVVPVQGAAGAWPRDRLAELWGATQP